MSKAGQYYRENIEETEQQDHTLSPEAVERIKQSLKSRQE